MQSKNDGPSSCSSSWCGRASNLAAFPGRLRVRSVCEVSRTSPSALHSQSRSSTRHDLLAGEPNAVTCALPSTSDSAAFSQLVLMDSQFEFSAAPRPSQRYRCRPLSRCPLRQCTLFTSVVVVLSWTDSLTPRVTESRHLHCRRVERRRKAAMGGVLAVSGHRSRRIYRAKARRILGNKSSRGRRLTRSSFGPPFHPDCELRGSLVCHFPGWLDFRDE